MMMDCPRCGFAQPQDRYCAKCGLDVDHYVAKPKPVWVRIVQNSNLHLTLIGILILLAVGYIFSAQRELLGRRMEALFTGLPLSSRESGDPNEVSAKAPEKTADPAPETAKEAAPEVVPLEAATPAPAPSTAPAETEPSKLEFSSWEVSRETLTALLAGAEKVGESAEGRAYFFAMGSKIAEGVQTAGKKLSTPRSGPLPTSAPQGAPLTLETPPTASEAFQFGIYFQLSKVEGKDKEYAVKWESTLVMPPAETAAEAAAHAPAVKALSENSLNGAATLNAPSLLLIVFEPPNRVLREEYLTKAGEGPWSVFGSEDFRAGTSEWVMLVQIK